jgi:hypothetical protein
MSYAFPFGTGATGAPRDPTGYVKIAVPTYGASSKTTAAGTVRSVLCRFGKSRAILPLFVPAPP